MSHLSGISWKVPSGKVLLIVIGSIPVPNSFSAMSIGLERPSEISTSIGAPIDI